MKLLKCLAFLFIFISCEESPIEPMEEELECKAESFVGVWKYVATNNNTVLDSMPDITITLAKDNHILIDSLVHREIHSSLTCRAGKSDNVFGGNYFELHSNDILLKHSRSFFALTLSHKYERQ